MLSLDPPPVRLGARAAAVGYPAPRWAHAPSQGILTAWSFLCCTAFVVGEPRMCPYDAWTYSCPLPLTSWSLRPVLHALPAFPPCLPPQRKGSPSALLPWILLDLPDSGLTLALCLDPCGSLANSFPFLAVLSVVLPAWTPPWIKTKPPSDWPLPLPLLCKLHLHPDLPTTLPDTCCAFWLLCDPLPWPGIFLFLYSTLTSLKIKVKGVAQESFSACTDLLSLTLGSVSRVPGTRMAVVVVVIVTAHSRRERLM